MPDIAMCSHATCPARAKCRRHADSGTRPSKWQWYSDFEPGIPDDQRCNDYWPGRDWADGLLTETEERE